MAGDPIYKKQIYFHPLRKRNYTVPRDIIFPLILVGIGLTLGNLWDRLQEKKMSSFKGKTAAWGDRTIHPGWQPGYGPKSENLE